MTLTLKRSLTLAVACLVLDPFLAIQDASAGCFDTRYQHSQLFAWPERPLLDAVQHVLDRIDANSMDWKLLHADGRPTGLGLQDIPNGKTFDQSEHGEGDDDYKEIDALSMTLNRIKARSWRGRVRAAVKALGLKPVNKRRSCPVKLRKKDSAWVLVHRGAKPRALPAKNRVGIPVLRYSHLRCYGQVAVVRLTPEGQCAGHVDIYLPLPRPTR